MIDVKTIEEEELLDYETVDEVREPQPDLTPEFAQLAARYLVAAALADPERLPELAGFVTSIPDFVASQLLRILETVVSNGLPLDLPVVLNELEKPLWKVKRTAIRAFLQEIIDGLPTFDPSHFDEYREIVAAEARRSRVFARAKDIALAVRAREPLGDALAELNVAVTEHSEGKADHNQRGGDWFAGADPKVIPIWGTPERCAWADGEGFMLCGQQGTGKTTIFGQLLFALLGLTDPIVLGMPVTPVGRVGYIAGDRPKQIKRAHARLWLPEHTDALNEQLVVHEGPFDEDLAECPDQLVRWALANQLDVVFIDSLKDLAVKLSDDAVGAKLNRAFQLLVREGINLGMNHHQVKRNAEGKEPNSLADVYGSVWITSGLGSVIYLGGNPGDALVRVKHLKQPSGHIDTGGMVIEHDHHTGLSQVESQVDPLRELRRARLGLTARALAQVLCDKPVTPLAEIPQGCSSKFPTLVVGEG